MSVVQSTLSDTLASLYLLCVVGLIGYPLGALIARFGRFAQPSLGVSWILGFFCISVASWRAFEAGIKLAVGYRLSLLVAFILTSIVLGLRRQWLKPHAAATAMRSLAPDLAAFTVCVVEYAGLVHSKLAADDLDWPTILNADIFVYMRASAYLALFPGGQTAVGDMDLHAFVEHDVFGAFGLLAFAKFVLHSEFAHLAIPTVGLGVGLIGMAVVRSCRVVFGIGLPLSLLLGLVTVTGPLFQYIVLNDFLAQILFLVLLLTVSLWMTEKRPSGWRSAFAGSAVISAASGSVLLCYDVWAIQFVAIVSSLVAALRSLESTRRQRDRLGIGIVSGVCSAGLALGVMAATSPLRLGGLASKLLALSVPNAAGWALPFVDFGLLLGLPYEWGLDPTPKAGIAGSIMGSLVLLAVVGLASSRLDVGFSSVGRKVTFGFFCIGAMAYLLVWARFGDSYQQWKFASTFPLGFGFAVIATATRLLQRGVSRRWSAPVGLTTAAFLVTCLWVNISVVHNKSMATLAHIPASLTDLERTDESPGEEPIYVDTDNFQIRMAALAFIARRPVNFSGISQFGTGHGPPTSERFLTYRQVCNPAGGGTPTYNVQTTRHDELPSVPLDQAIELSQDVASCLSLTGFGDPEPWGRRSLGHHAAIRFDCACDLVAAPLDVVLHAAAPMLPELPGQQVAFIAVDGTLPQVYPLDAKEFRDIVIPLPKRAGGGSGIDLQIDLPEAAPRSSADPEKGPLFALSLVSVELRRREGER